MEMEEPAMSSPTPQLPAECAAPADDFGAFADSADFGDFGSAGDGDDFGDFAAVETAPTVDDQAPPPPPQQVSQSALSPGGMAAQLLRSLAAPRAQAPENPAASPEVTPLEAAQLQRLWPLERLGRAAAANAPASAAAAATAAPDAAVEASPLTDNDYLLLYGQAAHGTAGSTWHQRGRLALQVLTADSLISRSSNSLFPATRRTLRGPAIPRATRRLLERGLGLQPRFMQRRIQHSLPLRFDLEEAAARLQKLDTEELEQWADTSKEQIERLFQELIEVLEYRDKLENELDSRRRLIAILRAVSEKDNVAPHSNSQGGLLNGMRATATAAFAPSSSAGVSRVVVPYRSGVTLAQPQACESLVQILMAMRAQKEEDFRSRLMDYMDTVL